MWDTESQRIGKMKCSPLAYNLHIISDLIGLVSMLVLFGGFVSFLHTNWKYSIILILYSFISAFLGNLLYRYSWKIIERKGFEYDYRKLYLLLV